MNLRSPLYKIQVRTLKGRETFNNLFLIYFLYENKH